MKTIVLFLSLLFVTSLTGCFSDHYDSNDNYGLEGPWNLTHISGGVSGMNISFEPGVILWTFDEDNKMVTIVNTSEDGYSAFESGTYSYSVERVGGNISITIDAMTFGSVEIFQNEVHLDQTMVDGIFLELTK